MDIKELGVGGVFVIGGMAYGFSEYGLNSVLSEEIKSITEVSQAERPAYMETVTTEFQNNFLTYQIETENYLYVGNSEFSSSPRLGKFIENVTSESPVPKNELVNIRKLLNNPIYIEHFCGQEEMSMFTEKGWSYKFTVKDSNGREITKIDCSSTVDSVVS